MNETDFIRQQLARERAHLQEILGIARTGSAAVRRARPIAAYIEWASRRLLAQLGEPAGTVTPERLLALIETWRERLEPQAGQTLPISHWRRIAPLSADIILQERQLYAAARAAAQAP